MIKVSLIILCSWLFNLSVKNNWVCANAAKSPQNYTLPHQDCTKFYVCQFLGGSRHSDRSWKAHVLSCPEHTGFDKLLKSCNHLYNLKQPTGKCGNTFNCYTFNQTAWRN